MPSNSRPADPAVAYAGQIADSSFCHKTSKACEGANVVAGMLVKRGTDVQDQVMELEAGDTANLSGILAGVVVLETARAQDDSDLEDDDAVSVLDFGTIYMEFAEAVTAGEQVAVVLASNTYKGYAQGTAAGSIPTGEVVIPQLRIEQTTAAAGPARVSVNLMGYQPDATVGAM